MTIEEQVNHIITMDVTDENSLDNVLFNDDQFADIFSQPDVSYLSDKEQAIFYRNLNKIYNHLELNA